ncbi:XRE family transcriptional regulator [Paractinoplanes lichenicola]|uniref:Tetratricopeptide repeat protein n=1 Tax=Paractinoplanes lichenicola TaxID=2802976 RepID=A0ABS1W0H9_9ACTN|nr:XRE family transcriptional regulator [Actinoplanes lichenicola]MBL7260243.1 tetratricopeptide repeat protein [Actinoplanes lichenicola]
MSEPQDGPVAAFCADLRRRWRESGRELVAVAREIKISRTQLYAILNGDIKRPPDFDGVVEPLLRACGAGPDEVAVWRQRHEVLTGVHAEIRRRRPPARLVPAQLPADLGVFHGRHAALAALDAATAPVVTISGVAGVGKTALAVHWAHRAAGRYPDGQLYADLRGFDRDEPADPAEVIRTLLDGLGAEPGQIPAGRDGQAALFRTLTSGRRLLVVLDNARDAAQVRPLLAAGPGVRTLITSRDRLTALVAGTGADPIRLDPPEPDEAVALLQRRAPIEAGAAATIVAGCGRLPLALALVAARVRQSGFSTPAAGLDDVRAVFSWSYDALGADAARLFRLLGPAAGDDIALPAAAALAGLEPIEARPLLRELVDASLLSEPAPGRFRLHDLLRAYARELAGADERRAALTRLLDHYTHTAYQAELALNPARAPIMLALESPPDETRPKQRVDIKAALEWLGTERAVLMAALRQAADEGLDRRAWQLGWALDTFLYQNKHWQDEDAAWAVALRAATALVDQPAAAQAHRFLAVVAGRLERFGDADEHMLRSAELCRQAGDDEGAAETEFMLSYVCWLRGDHDGALAHAERSLQQWTSLGDPLWAAKAGNAVAWYHAQLGDHPRAVAHYEAALSWLRDAGDQPDEAVVRHGLGLVRLAQGDHTGAAEQLHAGLDLVRRLDDPLMEAQLALSLGDVLRAAGDPAAARPEWERAHALLTAAGHPQAADVARKLAAAR